MGAKKVLSTLLAVALAASLLAGCGNTSGSTATADTADASAAQTSGTDEASTPAADNGEKQVLDIAIFEGGLGRDYWDEMMAMYQELHPNVEFNATISPKVGEIIRPRIVAGDVPDFIVLHDTDDSGLILSMIKDKALMDITDVFDGPSYYDENTPLRDIIMPGYLESKKYAPYGDGRIYLAPRDYACTGIIYNKTFFDEMGWELPETWDEFFALGELARAEDRSLFGYAGIHPKYLEHMLLPALANEIGMEGMQAIFDYEENSFNSPEVIEVLKVFERIQSEGYLMEGTLALNHTQSQTEFMMGKCVFLPCGMWIVNEMLDGPREEGFEYGVMAAPSFEKGGDRYLYSNYGQYSIPADAKNPEVAKDFLRFLYTEESARVMAEKSNSVLCMQGAIDIAKDYINPNLYEMYSIFEDTQPIFADYSQVPSGSKINIVEEIFQNGATKVMGGQATAEEWAEIVEKAFAQIRDERSKEE